MNFAAVEREMDAAVARGVFPGVVVLANVAGQVVFHRAAGSRSLEPERSPMREDTMPSPARSPTNRRSRRCAISCGIGWARSGPARRSATCARG